MGRTSILIALVFAVIIGIEVFSGCVTNSPGANNTTLTPTSLPTALRANQASLDTIPAYGHVYLDNKTVTGAYVIAVSTDGTDSVSTTTNDSGMYSLNVTAGKWYKVTAVYQGLQHTVFPVIMPKTVYTTDQFDVNLSRNHRSTIAGTARALVYSINGHEYLDQRPFYKGNGIYIEAVANNNSTPIIATTGDDGSYSMDVEPGIYYYVTSQPLHYDDKYTAMVSYRNTYYSSKIKVGQDETALLDYIPSQISWVESLRPIVAPPSPIQASGQVFLEGSTVKGAIVEADPIDGADHIATLTDDNGTYVLNLESSVTYKITARYQGLQHTIRPVRLDEYTAKGYSKNDIYLTTTPKSSISGTISPHHMIVEATPVNGGTTVSATNGYNTTYSLDVQPDTVYSLSGGDYYGQVRMDFRAQPHGYLDEIMVGSNETLLVDVGGIFLH